MVAVLNKLTLAPTLQDEVNARRIAALVNDKATPKLVRNALLSCLLEAAEVTKTPIFYVVGDDELRVSPRDLAFMLCVADGYGLDFERGGIVDEKGEFIQRRK